MLPVTDAEGLLLLSNTFAPPTSAGFSNVTVTVELVPPLTLLGESEIFASWLKNGL
jgi:hypothetical protein